MKFKILILITIIGFSRLGFGQNLNMVIDVNGRLVVSEIANVNLYFEYNDGTKDRILVSYHPGDLILKNDSWQKINSDNTEKIKLSFDYYSSKKGNLESVNFEVEMEKSHFQKPYLLLHIYDFRKRKYRKKYGCLTKGEYITELNFPECGILVSCG